MQWTALATGIARQQAAKSLELRSGTDFARLLQSQGRTDEARDLLKRIYDWFTQGFDTPDLKEAKAAVDEFS